MFSLRSHCRSFQEKQGLLLRQWPKSGVVEALRSEVVHVLVVSWLLPVKGGIIKPMDQLQRRQRPPHSDWTVILPFEQPIVWKRKDYD